MPSRSFRWLRGMTPVVAIRRPVWRQNCPSSAAARACRRPPSSPSPSTRAFVLAAAFGAGAIGLGDLLDSCGTAEALVRTVPPGLAPHAIESAVASGVSVAWHVVEGRWALVGGFLSGKLLAEPGGAARIPELAARARDFRLAIEAVAGPSDRLVVTGGWGGEPGRVPGKRGGVGGFWG